jgi:hypothetical protein
MAFLLSSQNVLQYLNEKRICLVNSNAPNEIKIKGGKNFNLLVSFLKTHQFLVKQERHDLEGNTAGEFWHEWAIDEFLRSFPELGFLRSFVSEIVYFDPIRSIIVLNYRDDYCDLMDFCLQEQIFPVEIAASIGETLSTIHRTTLDRQDYKDFFSQKNWDKVCIDSVPSIFHGLSRISPEVYGKVRTDCLDFFRLYQRDEDLGQAIAQLEEAWQPCCLIHNDLRLCNFLLHLDWKNTLTDSKPENPSMIRLIDWEKFVWGDPAFDLGTVIAGYLSIWLNSLVINPNIGIDTALRLAATPLEHLQPSLIAFVSTYFKNFPAFQKCCSQVLERAMQFAGTVLIQKILVKLDHRSGFGNTEICMLHAAKTLLCAPNRSISTIFGLTSSELFSVEVQP